MLIFEIKGDGVFVFRVKENEVKELVCFFNWYLVFDKNFYVF